MEKSIKKVLEMEEYSLQVRLRPLSHLSDGQRLHHSNSVDRAVPSSLPSEAREEMVLTV